MKKFLFLFSILLAGVFQSLNAQAVIKFDKTTHNFGTFSISKPQTVTFSFTNTGDKPLVIQQAFASNSLVRIYIEGTTQDDK